MPEMTEMMYAHQQICIPPTFPYLLRQYAKAAIRSQPADLLKWSTAYFRALSLGLTPPVKPRLEYPIPKSHKGLTPGWLKTLLRQLAGNTFVSWPVLVDRWQGACMDVTGLIEIIMVGGFTDPAEVPWLRFVAVAAGFITMSLTNTMILLCELLTEEPEGGSSMIPARIFIDLYKFLAEIDAGEEKVYRNFYFTESNMDLTKKEPEFVTEVEMSVSFKEGLVDEEATATVSLLSSDKSDLLKYLETIEGGADEDQPKDEKEKAPAKVEKKEESIDTDDSCFNILEPEDKKDKSGKSISSSESSESIVEVETAKSISKISTLGEVESFILMKEPSRESERTSESSKTESSGAGWTDVTVPAVPGIGPVVPPEMVDAVVKYVKEVAAKQQGMIMPRNIKHFLCPPLEEMEQ